MLHGNPTWSYFYRHLVTAIAPRARCIVPDIRGFGHSSTHGPYSMDQYADDVAALLDWLQLEQAVICGLSMGGYGTWDAIARYPGFFAAAAPICGGGDPKTVDKFKSLPIWCFHGAKDPVVKVIRSREMIEALQKVGSNAKYTEYPEAQHDSWTQTYSNPELFDWMFAQRRESN
jgi:pimeloyl-ACP methyl ester carboxylesterase